MKKKDSTLSEEEWKHEREKDRKSKNDKKSNWFKNRDEGNTNKFTSVMFVEATPNGELARKLREVEDKLKISENISTMIVLQSRTHIEVRTL